MLESREHHFQEFVSHVFAKLCRVIQFQLMKFSLLLILRLWRNVNHFSYSKFKNQQAVFLKQLFHRTSPGDCFKIFWTSISKNTYESLYKTAAWSFIYTWSDFQYMLLNFVIVIKSFQQSRLYELYIITFWRGCTLKVRWK